MQLKLTYIPKELVEIFVIEFHKGATQRHNKATALVARLQTKYIIKDIWNIAKKVVKECPDYQKKQVFKT